MTLYGVPGLKALTSKTGLTRTMEEYRQTFPHRFQFYPPSFILPEDGEALHQVMQAHPNKSLILVVKPEGSAGIRYYPLLSVAIH